MDIYKIICVKTDKIEKGIKELEDLICSVDKKITKQIFEKCNKNLDTVTDNIKELEEVFNEMSKIINKSSITIHEILTLSLI